MDILVIVQCKDYCCVISPNPERDDIIFSAATRAECVNFCRERGLAYFSQ